MAIRHLGSQVVRQELVVARPSSWRGGRRGWSDLVTAPERALRDRVTHQAQSLFGGVTKRTGRPYRPQALLTPEQLWQVYLMSPDVRSAVDSIARRISTWDWDVTPAVPLTDEKRFRQARDQARAIRRFLRAPGDSETWQTFWTKLATDALVFWHGVAEAAFDTDVEGGVVDGRPVVDVGSGFLQEFVPVYAPTIHPVTDEHGRLIGYVQDLAGTGEISPKESLLPLSRDQILRLVISPNTRSPYAVPIIETIVQEVTTLVHSSERASRTMKSSEIPPGFLVLTGTKPQVEKGVKKTAEEYAGRDHKLRIIHTPGAQSPAQWLRLDHTMRELEFLPVTKEARKSVWRAFGVTPIEMGDTEDVNRASARVELEVGSSHLIEPLLETIESLVNARMIPLVLASVTEDREAEVLVEFGFDRSTKLTPEEERAMAQADQIRLDTGQRSINELRVRDGLPRIEGGDDYRIGDLPVGESILQVDGESEDMGPSVGEEAPGENADSPEEEMSRVVIRAHQGAEDLPSGWRSPGRFDDARTINLQVLWDEVVSYRRKIEPLWAEAKAKVLAVTGASHRAGTIGDARFNSEVGSALGTLRSSWAMVTLESYQRVGRIGRDSARRITGNDTVGSGSDQVSEQYHRNAMVYLDQLISDIRSRLTANALAARGNRITKVTRVKVTAEDFIAPGAPLEDLFKAIEKTFDANEHRIDNWSGRLVELGNTTMVRAMAEDLESFGSELVPGEAVDAGQLGAEGQGEWWVVWDAVFDGKTCETCEREASFGARPMSMLSVLPGGDTICRARCRCVLRWLTPAEAALE